jgi:hypothetical protein
MLNGRLALWDISDVESFCAAVVPRSWRNQLSQDDREQLLTWLIETAWELSVVYTPGGISFSTFAGNTLRRRIHDWLRNRDGRTVWKFKDRTHHRPRPTLVSLNNDDGGLVGSVGDFSVDGPEHRVSDLAGLLGAGNGTPAEVEALRRPPPTRRAA